MRYLLFVVLSISLASCAGSFYDIRGTEPAYVANKMHVPFFNKVNQFQAEASVSESFEFAAGYSPLANIGLVSSLRLKDPSSSDSDFHRNRYVDVGAGYFLDSIESLRVEVFARVGVGSTNSSDRYNPFEHPFIEDTTVSFGLFAYDYTKYSLQVNGGWEWQNWMLGLSFRAGYMDLQNISRNIKTLHDDSLVIDSFQPSQGTSFFDMAYTVRYRIVEKLWVELQLVFGNMKHVVGFRDIPYGEDTESDGGGAFTLFLKL